MRLKEFTHKIYLMTSVLDKMQPTCFRHCTDMCEKEPTRRTHWTEAEWGTCEVMLDSQSYTDTAQELQLWDVGRCIRLSARQEVFIEQPCPADDHTEMSF